ncbi:MAG TPA: [acyl-carrier-protein] S-malonyltransferase [Deltaproteobacteria bacterium]|nr:[acyl-carrier-protein] S-malonyltransferase [Deltaproteobacteria bacterium]
MGKVLLFPGQGAQFVGMGNDVIREFPEVKVIYEEASDRLGFDIKNLIMNGPDDKLTMTENAQPAILTTSYALWSIIQSRCELSPAAALGHSLGEYSALVTAGSISFADAVMITHLRGKFMQEAVPVGFGKMAAIMAPAVEVERECAKAKKSNMYCDIANYNGPNQQVVSGTKEGVNYVEDQLKERFKIFDLTVSAPFHCKLMEPAREKLASFINDIGITSPSFTIIENIDSKLIKSNDNIAELLLNQIISPVKWIDNINTACGFSQSMIEFGPGSVLRSLIRRIDKKIKVQNIEKVNDIDSFLKDCN